MTVTADPSDTDMDMDMDMDMDADAYRHSLALCIIESVQSSAVQSSAAGSEVAVVDRYLAYRHTREIEPVTDGARALLRTFEEAGSSDQWAGKVGSYKRRYCATDAPIEARHILHAAECLHKRRIDSTDDLALAARDEAAFEEIHRAWLEACDDRSDVTWALFLTLAGIPDA